MIIQILGDKGTMKSGQVRIVVSVNPAKPISNALPSILSKLGRRLRRAPAQHRGARGVNIPRRGPGGHGRAQLLANLCLSSEPAR
eukprot:gene1054-16116_t